VLSEVERGEALEVPARETLRRQGTHAPGCAEADASGYVSACDMGQVGKVYFCTVGTNRPLFPRTEGTGGVREKMSYFRQRWKGVAGTAWVRPQVDSSAIRVFAS
jgi:hypothetical protein